jgi:similar to stage IV sporulation protein
MQRILNKFRGVYKVSVICAQPEEFLNLCARYNIAFWDVRRVNEAQLEMMVLRAGVKLLTRLEKYSGFEMNVIKSTGAAVLAGRLRHRYAFIGGMLFFIAMVWVLSMHVWQIDVYGNENVSDEQILAQLEELGLDLGTFGLSVDSEYLSNRMIMRIPELSWFAVNIKGSRAQVLVRERVAKPEIHDPDEPVMVVAAKSGVIEKIVTLEGTKILDRGNTVLQGDIIVSGIAENISGESRTVHASAIVYARTWYTISARLPGQSMVKEYTGKEKIKTALIIAGKRINFSLNSGIEWPDYDKITLERTIELPMGGILPVTFVTERYLQYEAKTVSITQQQAEELLMPELMQRLEEEIDGGEIADYSYETTVSGGGVTVTLKAECIEQIAQERKFTDSELAAAETETETENE